MPRVRIGSARRKKHKRILKDMRGYVGSTSRRHKLAKQKRFKSGVYATRDRKTKKREFRSLWITRLTAACRARGFRYSQLIFGLQEIGILLNRKMLSEIAIADPAAFDILVEKAKANQPVVAK